MKTKFLILILIAGLLTACGAPATEVPASAPTDEPAPATQAPTNPPAATDTAVPTVEQPTLEPTLEPTAAPAAGPTTVSFSRDILPILESRCLTCHGGGRTQAGLDLKSYASLMAGSENGPVVVPGSAADSLFVDLVTSQEMPKRGPKLTPEQVQLVTTWVNEGALDN